MSKGSERVKTWRRKTKERLVKAFGGQCAICGVDDSPCIMDFHHLVSEEKAFGLGGARGSVRSWEKIAEEAKKCVMLCANCHRRHHYENVIIPEDAPRFDEKYLDYKKREIENCPVCGSEKKSNRQSTCSVKCAGKKRGKVDWAIYDDLLREEIKKKTPLTKIGQMIGISDNGVRKRAKKKGFL